MRETKFQRQAAHLIAEAFQMERPGLMTNFELAEIAVRHLAEGGFEIVRKEPAPGPVMASRVTREDGSVTELRSAPVETETEKATKWAARLIGEILGDGWDRQAEAGVEGAAKEAVARLRRDRGRMAFEDIDRNPPAAASHADYLVATWVRSLGDAVEWCEARLLPRRLVLTTWLRRPPSAEQAKDLDHRLDLIRELRGVVGVDYSGFARQNLSVEVRFDFYISTIGCEYTPGELPARPARTAA